MKMMVLRAASRMKSKKGLLASKIILFMGKERPETRTAVAADASLPSSFTYQPKEKMGLKYRHYAAVGGLSLLPHRFGAQDDSTGQSTFFYIGKEEISTQGRQEDSTASPNVPSYATHPAHTCHETSRKEHLSLVTKLWIRPQAPTVSYLYSQHLQHHWGLSTFTRSRYRASTLPQSPKSLRN